MYKSLGGANTLGLPVTPSESQDSDGVTIRRGFKNGSSPTSWIVNNRLTGETEAIKDGEHPSWYVYERMSKEFIYPPDSNDINSYRGNSFRDYGYEVDRVIENRSTGLFALGLKSNTGRPPVLVFRGTDALTIQDILSDINPDGVGRNQFDAGKSDILAWIDRARILWGSPDVIGHSLGGALAQRTAAEWTDRIGKLITFNSSGVGNQNARDFEDRGGLNKTVVHYLTQFDPVTSGGEKFLTGKVVEMSGKNPGTGFVPGVTFAQTYLAILLGTTIAGKSALDNHLDSALVSDSGRSKSLLSINDVNNSSLRQYTEKVRQGLGNAVRTGSISIDLINSARISTTTLATKLILDVVLNSIRFCN